MSPGIVPPPVRNFEPLDSRRAWPRAGHQLSSGEVALPVLRRVWCAALLLVLACTSLKDDLRRAEQAFAEARYEDVQVWLDDLEPSLTELTPAQRARYYYLGGMSAYRIGERARARHLLALCRAELESPRVELPSSWQQHMNSALAELR